MGLALLTLSGVSGFADGAVDSTFNTSASGTTSATVFVPEGRGYANVTDLAWKLDSGVTTGTVAIRSAIERKKVTSATASSAQVIYISNPGNSLTLSNYVIFLDASTGTHYLRRIAASSTTSVTLDSSISGIASTTDDVLYLCAATVTKPVINLTSATVAPGINLWLPNNLPTALTLDGNTTACQIEASGVRSQYK